MRSTALRILALLVLAGCEGSLSSSVEVGLTCATLEREAGAVVIEGDLRFASAEDARAFLEEHERSERDSAEQRLVLGVDEPIDTTLPPAVRQDLAYCVSAGFGEAREAVLRGALRATEIWSSSVDVRFRLVEPERCETRGVDAHLVVLPACSAGNAIAEGMLPYRSGLEGQEIEINTCHPDYDAFVDSDDAMARILLHELGHVLGFVHAWNTDDYDGTCGCSSSIRFRTLSGYDPGSIMNYPSCGATWDLFDPPALTEQDRADAQSVYCAPGEGPPPCGS